MWHPCGYNGRDWLWKNMPHSIHVWLTVWAWWTKEHATNEGMIRTGLCKYGLIFWIEGVIYSEFTPFASAVTSHFVICCLPNSLNLNGEKGDEGPQ